MGTLQINKEVSYEEKLELKEKLGFGVGDAACQFAMTTILTYLMYFYTDIFGLSVGAVGTLFLVARIWDAVNDPIIGRIIDMGNPKHGKYKSYILYGSIPLCLFSILCFTAPELPYYGKVIYAYITYIGAGMLYTLVNTAYSSLTSVITDSPSERTNLTAIRMYTANVGIVLLSFGVPMIVDIFGKESQAFGFQVASVIFASIAFVLFLITYFTTTERIKVETVEKINFKEMVGAIKVNKPLVMLCFIFIVVFINSTISSSVGMYYIKYNVNREDLTSLFILSSSLPGLISLAFIPFFVKTIGKKNSLILATIASMCGLALIYLTPYTNITVIFIGRLIAGFGATLIMGLIFTLVPDTIDYGEYITNKRLAGITYASVGFFLKIGAAVGGIIPTIIMGMTGYIPNVVQNEATLNGIRFVLTGIPFILFLIVLIPMFKYKLDNKECERIALELKYRRS